MAHGGLVTYDADVDKDTAKGIYHFYIGSDRGLVKEIKFRKTQMKYFTEMMVEKSFKENKEGLQLWNIFDVDMTMVGNSLLRPGMLFYINPTLTGMGDPRNFNSTARSLGLGGYYLTTSVSNTMSDKGWTTNITGKWQSSGNTGAEKLVYTPQGDVDWTASKIDEIP